MVHGHAEAFFLSQVGAFKIRPLRQARTDHPHSFSMLAPIGSRHRGELWGSDHVAASRIKEFGCEKAPCSCRRR